MKAAHVALVSLVATSMNCAPARTGAAAGDPPSASRVVELAMRSRTFGNTRAIRVYLPAGYHDTTNADRYYPVLYMNDGFAVFAAKAWNAPAILDSLIACGAIEPIILVGIDNAASIAGSANPVRDRANEFLPYPDDMADPGLPQPRGLEYPTFLVDEVMPFVASSFRATKDREKTGVGGSSLGGIAALVSVLQRPGVFGALVLESVPVFLFDEKLVEESRTLREWPEAVYVGVGTREKADDERISEMASSAQAEFVSIVRLHASHTRLLVNVSEGATHNSKAWRARLPAALTFLYGAGRR